jgi:phosphatidate cytidylyltransferase
MGEYLLPYLLLMAHFVSGALWLIRINRRLDPGAKKQQWTKYGVYLLLVNLLWFCLLWVPSFFPLIGWIVILLSAPELWKAVKKVRGRLGLMLAFLIIAGGFAGFLYMDAHWILYTLFVVLLFDGSCQVAGQLLGKRALLPRISPRKTVEGLAGGALITLATTLLTRKSFAFEWSGLILTTCLIMAAAFTGDMLASAVKRKAKITTFGRVIPGHGGVMDRFDSLMMTGAIVYLLSVIQQWMG